MLFRSLQEICPQAQEWELVRELSYLSVPEEILWRPYQTLSKGEQTKAQLAACFLREGNFLLIDEPTNHLDAEGRQLAAAYLKKKKGFILVSHDRRFLDGCVDHILSLNRADIEVQSGNFSSWMENFSRQQEFELQKQERLKKDIRRLGHDPHEPAQRFLPELQLLKSLPGLLLTFQKRFLHVPLDLCHLGISVKNDAAFKMMPPTEPP